MFITFSYVKHTSETTYEQSMLIKFTRVRIITLIHCQKRVRRACASSLKSENTIFINVVIG